MTTKEMLETISNRVASIRIEANLVEVKAPLLKLEIDDVDGYARNGTPISYEVEWEVSYSKNVYGYKVSRDVDEALSAVLEQIERIEQWNRKNLT